MVKAGSRGLDAVIKRIVEREMRASKGKKPKSYGKRFKGSAFTKVGGSGKGLVPKTGPLAAAAQAPAEAKKACPKWIKYTNKKTGKQVRYCRTAQKKAAAKPAGAAAAAKKKAGGPKPVSGSVVVAPSSHKFGCTKTDRLIRQSKKGKWRYAAEYEAYNNGLDKLPCDVKHGKLHGKPRKPRKPVLAKVVQREAMPALVVA
jgi:hypothetical protein